MSFKENGTWWALTATGLLGLTALRRPRGSQRSWRAEVTRIRRRTDKGEFLFDLDSSDYEDLDEEEDAAWSEGESRAVDGLDPEDGWDFDDEDDEYEMEDLEDVTSPSIRDLKDKK
tara:strand:+ start:192 stop:539 length:348 start_codon:yes stop_codon:yes gene_type:complete